MAPRSARSKSTDKGAKSEAARTHSAEAKRKVEGRRRKIQAEVGARNAREKDAFELQTRMIAPGVGEALMLAAKELFQAADYLAVVEERALEGVCGYPPCSACAVGKVGGKRWKVAHKQREVYSQEEIGRFCSFECLDDNAKFVAALDVDPGYIRPAAAVATARSAVAAADEAHRSGSRKRSTSGRRTAKAKDAVAPAAEPLVATSTESVEAPPLAVDGEAVVGCSQSPAAALPKVRPSAVVRFSRKDQSYSVKYSDFDGGGGLPEASNDACATPDDVSQAPKGRPGETKEELIHRLASAPIVERLQTFQEREQTKVDVKATTSVAAPTAVAAEAPAEAPVAAPLVAAPAVAAPPVVASPVGPVAAPSAAPAAAPSASATPKPAAPEPAAPAPASAPAASAAAEPAITKDENEKDEEDDSGSDAGSDAGASDCSSGPDLFEADAKAEPPSSPFVRTIGVLGSWLTPHAKEVLQCGAQAAQRRPGQGACEDTDSEGSPREELEDLPRPKEWKPTRLKPKDDDDRNVQRSRRELLRSELSSRIPPDVSYLAHRLDEVACALGVHQALPSVGEPALWDLAAALFLRALLRIEVRRGVLMPNADAEAILNREVDSAARSCLGKQLTQEQRSSQLEVLDAQLALPERPPSGLLALCSD